MLNFKKIKPIISLISAALFALATMGAAIVAPYAHADESYDTSNASLDNTVFPGNGTPKTRENIKEVPLGLTWNNNAPAPQFTPGANYWIQAGTSVTDGGRVNTFHQKDLLTDLNYGSTIWSDNIRGWVDFDGIYHDVRDTSDPNRYGYLEYVDVKNFGQVNINYDIATGTPVDTPLIQYTFDAKKSTEGKSMKIIFNYDILGTAANGYQIHTNGLIAYGIEVRPAPVQTYTGHLKYDLNLGSSALTVPNAMNVDGKAVGTFDDLANTVSTNKNWGSISVPITSSVPYTNDGSYTFAFWDNPRTDLPNEYAYGKSGIESLGFPQGTFPSGLNLDSMYPSAASKDNYAVTLAPVWVQNAAVRYHIDGSFNSQTQFTETGYFPLQRTADGKSFQNVPNATVTKSVSDKYLSDVYATYPKQKLVGWVDRDGNKYPIDGSKSVVMTQDKPFVDLVPELEALPQTVNVKYQTEDGTVVDTKSKTNPLGADSTDESKFINDNLPDGYKIVNTTNSVRTTGENTVDYVVTVHKLFDTYKDESGKVLHEPGKPQGTVEIDGYALVNQTSRDDGTDYVYRKIEVQPSTPATTPNKQTQAQPAPKPTPAQPTQTVQKAQAKPAPRAALAKTGAAVAATALVAVVALATGVAVTFRRKWAK